MTEPFKLPFRAEYASANGTAFVVDARGEPVPPEWLCERLNNAPTAAPAGWVLVPREYKVAIADAGQAYLDSKVLSLTGRFTLPGTFLWYEFWEVLLNSAIPTRATTPGGSDWREIGTGATLVFTMDATGRVKVKSEAVPGLFLASHDLQALVRDLKEAIPDLLKHNGFTAGLEAAAKLCDEYEIQRGELMDAQGETAATDLALAIRATGRGA